MRDLKSDELSHVYGAGWKPQPPECGKKKRVGHSTSKKHRTQKKPEKKFTKKCD